MGKWAPPDVIASAQKGDESAVNDLIAAVWPACFRLAAMITGDRGLAEDAAQETCVIIMRKLRTLHRPEAFDAWLYRVVLRESARVRRRAGNAAVSADEIMFVDSDISIDVWRALGELSPELREVTVLFYFHDLPGEAIACALGVSHGAVRVRLSRAREQLRGRLEDYHFHEQRLSSGVTYHAV